MLGPGKAGELVNFGGFEARKGGELVNSGGPGPGEGGELVKAFRARRAVNW